jgi:hypothetical protein
MHMCPAIAGPQDKIVGRSVRVGLPDADKGLAPALEVRTGRHHSKNVAVQLRQRCLAR